MEFPSDKDSTMPLKPGKEPLHDPATLISSKHSSILRRILSAIHSMWRNHLDSFFAQLPIQFIAIIRSQAAVARQVGASEMSVSRWAQALKKHGITGLRSAGRTGRRPRLNEKQRARIRRVLLEGPEARGYSNCLWTLPRVADAIRDTCGITYHPGHVWRILRHLGWSCQRPSSKAVERDEEAIGRWKRYKWLVLNKSGP